MNRITKKLMSLFRFTRQTSDSTPFKRARKQISLSIEQLDDRCLPSGSPWMLTSNYQLIYSPNSTVVLQNVEQYQWSPASGMGFALQQGGNLYDLTTSAPNVANPIGVTVESFGLSSNGTIYDLIEGGTLQVSSTSSGSISWSLADKTAAGIAAVTESFAVTSNNTLYDLDAGGTLQVSADCGTTWSNVDNNSESFAATSGNTIYNLLVGGTLESSTNTGSSWNTLDTSTQSFAVSNSVNGAFLYDLDTGGSLRVLNSFGSWTTVDTNTQSFAVTQYGAIYNLLVGGTMDYLTNIGNTWNAFSVSNHTSSTTPIQSFSLEANGGIYVLESDGTLNFVNASNTWQLADGNVQSFAVSPNGTLYDLHTGGVLQEESTPSAAWNHLDSTLNGSTQTFTIGTNGTLYNLLTGGLLDYSNTNGSSWITLDTATQWFAVSGNGTLYDLADNPGELWITTNLGCGWGVVDTNTQSFTVGTNGALYNLLTNGVLESTLNTPNPTPSWTALDSLTSSFSLSANGSLSETDWFDTLQNPILAAQARVDYTRDGSITRSDFIGLLNTVIDSASTATASQLETLQTLVNASASATPLPGLFSNFELNMPNYVNNLAGKVVNGNPANAEYLSNNLGNISATSPNNLTSQLDDLELKWFYGTDLPTLLSSTPGTYTPGLYSETGVQYAAPGGTLFNSSGVPSIHDIAQGAVNDCYFLSAIGQIALQNPRAIENMFINNGDGTYTVRFYNNTVPDYVTVNMELPESTAGTPSFLYAGEDQYGQFAPFANSSNVLWVALAEKAYAQLAAEGWSRNETSEDYNSYNSIYDGDQLQETVTGQILGTNNINKRYAGTDTADAIQAILKGDLVNIRTPSSYNNATNTFAALDNTYFVPDHSYMVLSYNQSTQIFTFLNPYDTGYGTRYVYISASQLDQVVQIEQSGPPVQAVGYFYDVSVPGMTFNSVVVS